MSESGWLSLLPATLRTTLLGVAQLRRFAPDQIIYRYGDANGGMYGLVSGAVTINTSPPTAAPQLIHLGMAGAWTGEGPFLTGQPRRAELRALGNATLMHLPIEAMEQLAARDQGFVRAVAVNTVLTVDVLIRVVHDLQKRDVGRRLASVLQRVGWLGLAPVPVTQADLAHMANASRQQVNVAMKRFAAAGWIKYSYRSVSVLNPSALLLYSEDDT